MIFKENKRSLFPAELYLKNSTTDREKHVTELKRADQLQDALDKAYILHKESPEWDTVGIHSGNYAMAQHTFLIETCLIEDGTLSSKKVIDQMNTLARNIYRKGVENILYTNASSSYDQVITDIEALRTYTKKYTPYLEMVHIFDKELHQNN